MRRRLVAKKSPWIQAEGFNNNLLKHLYVYNFQKPYVNESTSILKTKL